MFKGLRERGGRMLGGAIGVPLVFIVGSIIWNGVALGSDVAADLYAGKPVDWTPDGIEPEELAEKPLTSFMPNLYYNPFKESPAMWLSLSLGGGFLGLIGKSK